LIGQAQTRREIVCVFKILMTRVAVHAHEAHAAFEIGESGLLRRQRGGRVEVEEVHAVVTFGARRIVIVTHAQIERQFVAYAPIILGITGVVEALRGDVLPTLDQDVARRPRTQ
jgi:hypothetical protein